MTVQRGAFSGFRTNVGFGIERAAKRLARLLGIWALRRRARLTLADLDDRLLRDIGIDRSEALREAARPFWDGAPRRR